MAEYTIDYNRGSDSNDGITAPWKNLSKLAALTPVDGDVIALASDSWWVLESRVLFPAHTNGTKIAPILITSYDPAGASIEKPRISLRKTLVASDFTYDAPNNGWYFDTSTMVGTGSLNWTCFLRLGGEDAIRQEAALPLVSVDKTWINSARLLYVYAPAGTNPVDYYGSVEFGHSAGAFTAANSGRFLIVEKIKICDGGSLLWAYASSGVRQIVVRDIESDDVVSAVRTLHDTGSDLSVDVHDSTFRDTQSTHVTTFSNGDIGKGVVRIFRNRFVGGNRGYPQGQIYLQTRLAATQVFGNDLSGAKYGTVHHQADGCAIYAEVGADRVTVQGNRVTDTYLAFQDNSGRGVVWAGNLIADCYSAIKVTDGLNVGSANHGFYNNTCLVGANIAPQGPAGTSPTGWRCYKASGSAMTVDVRNNIIFDQSGNDYGAAILTPQVTYTGTFTHNCLRGFPADGASEFGGAAPTVTNTVTSDPLLDASYRPMAGSPCLGAGTRVSGVRLRDFYGKEIDDVPDIGAVQRYAARQLANPQTIATARTLSSTGRTLRRAAMA